MVKRYATPETRGRIITLDILRGFFLTVIAVDHLQRFPSVWDIFTGRGMLWVSAAEGFFIISGLVVGYIYGPKMVAATKKTVLKIWRRALLLYGLTVGFTLLFTVFARYLLDVPGLKSGVSLEPWSSVLIDTLRLQYVYGWIDFLALYAVFMAVAPLAIYLTIKHKGWLVIVASLAAWALLRGIDARFGWQVFFMPAIVAGYYLPTIEAYIAKIPPIKKRKLYGLLTFLVVAMLAISTYFVFVIPFVSSRPGIVAYLPTLVVDFLNHTKDWYDMWLEDWFYKWTLPLPRIAFAWIWFLTLYVVVRHFEDRVLRITKDFFTVLGKNSLFTYCFMGVLLFGIHFILVPRVTRFNVGSLLINTIVTALFVASIYVAAKYKDSLMYKVKRGVVHKR